MNRQQKRRMRKITGCGQDQNVYIFIRDKHFYPIALADDEDARRNAEWNPGTTRVEDIEGNVIWRADH